MNGDEEGVPTRSSIAAEPFSLENPPYDEQSRREVDYDTNDGKNEFG